MDPAEQREFFFRVTGYEAVAIERLLLFYLLELDRDRWSSNEVDKVDFLATRMVTDTVAGDTQPDWARVESRCRSLVELRNRSLGSRRPDGGSPAKATDVPLVEPTGPHPDEISEVVDRFRSFKHRLGPGMLESEVWLEILRTNWRVKSGVRAVIRAEEELLLADLDRLFQLVERVALSRELDVAVTRIRRSTEVFERRAQLGNVRLQEILDLRREASSLLQRLSEEESAAEAGAPGAARSRLPLPAAETTDRPRDRRELPASGLVAAESVAGGRAALLAAVRANDRSDPRVEASVAADLDETEIETLVRLRRNPSPPSGIDLIGLDAMVVRRQLRVAAQALQKRDPVERAGSDEELAARSALAVASDALNALRVRSAEAVGEQRRDLADRLDVMRQRLESPRAALWLLLRTGRGGSEQVVGGEQGAE